MSQAPESASAPGTDAAANSAGGGGMALPFDPLLLLLGVWKRAWLIVLVTALISGLAVAVAMGARKKEWKSWVTILRKREQKEFLITSNTPIVKLQIYSMSTILRLVKLTENLERVIREVGLQETTPTELSSEIAVETPRDTDIIEIVVTWKNAQQAARIANALAHAFIARVDGLQKLEATQAYEYLSGQLEDLRRRTELLEQNKVKFKKDHLVVKLSDQMSQWVQQVAEFDTLAEKERLEAESARAALEAARQALGQEPATIVGSIFVKKPLQAHWVELQSQLAEALSVYTEQTPKVQELKDEIAKVEALIRQGLEEQLQEQTLSRNPVLSDLEQRIVANTVDAIAKEAAAAGYAKIRDRLAKRLKELPELESQLAELEAGLDSLRQIRAVLTSRVEEARIIRDSTAGNLSIMQEAFAAKLPEPSSSKAIVALGLFGGIALGLALATALELADTRIKAQREVERATGLQPIGELPRLRGPLFPPTPSPEQDLLLETFRQIMPRILPPTQPAPARVLLVLSALPGEGRSSVIGHMALLAPARQLRVCVVDTNFKKPSLPSLASALGLELRGGGLSSVLAGRIHWRDGLVRQPERPGLAWLPAGEPELAAVEMLGASAMQGLLAELRASFDLILIEAAPLLLATDAILLAPFCDSMLYVLEAFGAPRSAHREALRRLAGVELPCVGVLLNRVPPSYQDPFSVHGLSKKLFRRR